MAGIRKASAYSKRYARPFTRKSKKRTKSFVKTVPFSKIVKFKMGDLKGFDAGKYPITLTVKSKEQVQIRDNAIEAIRQFMNRFLLLQVGKEFYLEVKPYPHHFLRENKMLTGAGADRMQTGMSRAYGKTMGRAALIKKDQTIFVVAVKNTKDEITARKLVHSVKSRMPCKIAIDTFDVNNPKKNSTVVKKAPKKPKKKKVAAETAKPAAKKKAVKKVEKKEAAKSEE